jgi:hypothetical protein
MRTSIHGSVLLAGVCMMAGVVASGQETTSAKQLNAPFDVAITYVASRANVTAGNGFWMQGGSVQFHGQFWRGLGVVADVGALHTGDADGKGAGLDLVTATFGPRYTQSWAHHRHALFCEALAGEVHGFDSVFPTATGVASSADSLALQVGGGMNLQFSRHLAIRAFEAAWLRTQFPNATTGVQNNLRAGTGLVIKF